MHGNSGRGKRDTRYKILIALMIFIILSLLVLAGVLWYEKRQVEQLAADYADLNAVEEQASANGADKTPPSAAASGEDGVEAASAQPSDGEGADTAP